MTFRWLVPAPVAARSPALGIDAEWVHTRSMIKRSEYEVSIDDLVASAHIPFDEQVEEQVPGERPEHDESAGHLPGNVRPYGA